MEPASTKRFRFRLSLKGLLGATTFLAVVLAGLRASDLHPIEKGMVMAWALTTVIDVTLAPVGFRRLILAGLLCGAIGGCLPALLWYVKYGEVLSSWIEDCGYPILALTLAGAIAGATVGCATWLCARPRRIAMAAVACAIIALIDYGWRSLTYWHPLRTVQFDPPPQTFALSTDGQWLASDGETVQTWNSATGRLRLAQFGKPEFEHATSYNRMRFVAGDHRYLVAGRWGQDALHVFDCENGREVSAVPIPLLAVRFCRFTDEGNLAVGWYNDGREKIDIGDVCHWDRREPAFDAKFAKYMAMSADLKTTAISDSDRMESDGIRITRRGQPGSQRLAFFLQSEGVPLILSPNGRWLANYNRLFDLTTGRLTQLEIILGFSPVSTLVICLNRRQAGGLLHLLPDSAQTGPLLHCLPVHGRQYRLLAADASSGRIAARSEWLAGDGGQFDLANQAGLLMEKVGRDRVKIWQIPNGH